MDRAKSEKMEERGEKLHASVGKPGEKQEREESNVQKLVTSKQPGRETVCVCAPLSIKESRASYFSSVAEDVRTSSALLSALASGESTPSSLPVTI